MLWVWGAEGAYAWCSPGIRAPCLVFLDRLRLLMKVLHNPAALALHPSPPYSVSSCFTRTASVRRWCRPTSSPLLHIPVTQMHISVTLLHHPLLPCRAQPRGGRAARSAQPGHGGARHRVRQAPVPGRRAVSGEARARGCQWKPGQSRGEWGTILSKHRRQGSGSFLLGGSGTCHLPYNLAEKIPTRPPLTPGTLYAPAPVSPLPPASADCSSRRATCAAASPPPTAGSTWRAATWCWPTRDSATPPCCGWVGTCSGPRMRKGRVKSRLRPKANRMAGVVALVGLARATHIADNHGCRGPPVPAAQPRMALPTPCPALALPPAVGALLLPDATNHCFMVTL